MEAHASQQGALTVALDQNADDALALAAAVAVYRVLANPNRLRVLRALSAPKTVAQLRVELQITDPGSHLQDLAVVGLVERVTGSYPYRWELVPGAAERVSLLTELFIAP